VLFDLLKSSDELHVLCRGDGWCWSSTGSAWHLSKGIDRGAFLSGGGECEKREEQVTPHRAKIVPHGAA
jgi:hypothetical protein